MTDSASKYGYHLIMKQLENEFKSKNFHCSGKNTKKCKSSPVWIDKEISEERDLTTKFKTKLLDKIRIMPISLSNILNNIARKIHIKKFKK